jgi:hypothetical protein
MNSPSRLLVLLAAAALIFAPLARAATEVPVTAAGHWEGSVKLKDRDIPIVFDLAKDSKGIWIGTLGAPGSPVADVPLDEIKIADNSVRFSVRLQYVASFDATIAPDTGVLSGTASSDKGDTSFEAKRTGEAKVNLPAPSSKMEKEFAGDWRGTLEVGGKTLRLALKLAAGANDRAEATFVSVDQGDQDIPIATVSMNGKELKFESRVVSAKFVGKLSDDGEIAGEWSQGPARMPLVFKKAAAETAK